MRSAGMAPLAASLVVIAACTGPTSSNGGPTATTTGGSPTGSVPSPDATSGPEVWFAPLPPLPAGSDLPFNDGAVDYLDLWESSDAWPQTADRVRVFSIPGTFVEHYATDEDLRTIIEGVERRGMALALELGPLPASEDCGGGVEGFGGVFTLDQVRRIQSLGGTVDIVALDEPFAFGRFWDGANACHWSTDRIAREVSDYARLLRTVEPDVVIGDIEPVWSDISSEDLAEWLRAYGHANGERFAFLHLDADWERADWPQALHAAEGSARAEGVRTGLYYNGGETDSDEAWAALAMQRAYAYEEVQGGTPDDVVFGSWFDHPDHLLPESDPSTFTGLIRRYFGARTMMQLAGAASGDGALAAGTLTTVDGDPVVGAVALEATPLGGGTQVLSLSGVVPDEATSAVIVFRVNTEGAGPGEADVRVYGTSYTEEGSANRIHNPDFGLGLDGWGPYGEGSATVVASDRDGGRMLRLVAGPTQPLSVDATTPFPVTPGAAYRFSVEAAVPESSAGSAYAAIVYLGGAELDRDVLRLDPAAHPPVTVTTNQSGEFEFAAGDLAAGRYRLRISYAGDLGHWPAESESTARIRSGA